MSISGDFGKCEVRNWWGKSLRGCYNVWKLVDRDLSSSSYQSSSISSSWNVCLDIWIFRCVDGHGTKIRRKLTKPDFKIHCVEVGNQMRCTNVSCNFLHLRPSQPSIEGPSLINGQIGFQLLSHPSSKNKRNAPKK